MDPVIDGASNAWIMTSAALVLLMTPGLAFFYGGMCRSKSVLNMLMMSFSSLGIVSVLWVVYGYAIAFGTSRGGLVGWTSGYVGLGDLVENVTTDEVAVTFGLPDLTFAAFQVMFAVITVALISGAVADRMKFSAWLAFTTIWVTRRLLPGRALGVRLRCRGGRRRRDRRGCGLGLREGLRRLDREPPRCARLRRRHGGPHQRGRGRAGPRASCSASARASARRPCVPTTCRWS